MPKYGGDGYLYALIDAGIIVDKLTQIAEILNMGLCSIGVIDFDNISHLFKLGKYETLLHTVEIGLKLKTDRIDISESVITIKDEFNAFDEIAASNCELGGYSNRLRLVMLSGDYVPVNLPQRINNLFEHASVISLGGATEAAIWSIYYPINKLDNNPEIIPYGIPLTNQKFYVLNKWNDLCPAGVLGELCIGGIGLANEYINDVEKTRKAFIVHSQLGRIYRTGDYGILSPKGYIIFMGRKDTQVKINGYRIELSEIENILIQHESIRNALVLDRSDDKKKKYLVAYIVLKKKVDTDKLREYLLNKLPVYMIPRYFVEIDEIPLSSNGKVDKKQLVSIKINKDASKATAKTTVNVTSDVQNQLIDIWKRVLEVDSIDINDSLFELGGNSVSLVIIQKEIEKIMPDKVKLMDIFTNYTINKLSEFIQDKAFVEMNKNMLLNKVKLPKSTFNDYQKESSVGILRHKLDFNIIRKSSAIALEKGWNIESLFISAYAYLIKEISINNKLSIEAKIDDSNFVKSVFINLNNINDFEEVIVSIQNQVINNKGYNLSDINADEIKKEDNEVICLYSNEKLAGNTRNLINVYDLILYKHITGNFVDFSLEYNAGRINSLIAKKILTNYIKLINVIVENIQK